MNLERSYRRLLLAYPSRWRDERAEEVLGVLLDGAEARAAHRPAVAEAIDLVGHGLQARAGLTVRLLDERTRELTAVLALASLTALSSLCLFFGEWWPWPQQAVPGPDIQVAAFPGTPGPFLTAGGPLMAALLVPALLVVMGWPRAARVMLVGLVPVTVALTAVAPLLDVNRPALWTLCGLLAFSALALLAPVRRPALLAALAVGLFIALAYAVVADLDPSYDPRPNFYYGYLLQLLTRLVPLGVLAAVAVAGGWRAVRPRAW
ncbi:MAG: hypothetical protein ACR2K2_12835 [Mycobacteriales bacterium]